jgi:hypothetical protein
VATRAPVGSAAAAAALWWLYTPAVALLTLAMALGQPRLLAAGATAVVLALIAFGLLLARNLARARGMPVVVAHGWAALAALAVLLASGLSLAAAYLGHGFMARGSAIGLHVAFAAYGFMGLLVMGFSTILVPMFALSDSPATRPALAALALAVAALLLLALVALGGAPAWCQSLAIVAGGAALAAHVAQMLRALRDGLRRRLGRPLLLVRIGWAALGASLLAALAASLGLGFERQPALFGVLLIGGLLSFLLGMLSRIVPFLAAMHSGGGKRRSTMPSALTAERPLALHFHCHLAALALLLAAVLADSAVLARLAGAVGTVGAIAFARFFVVACQRIAPRAAAQDPAKETGNAPGLS